MGRTGRPTPLAPSTGVGRSPTDTTPESGPATSWFGAPQVPLRIHERLSTSRIQPPRTEQGGRAHARRNHMKERARNAYVRGSVFEASGAETRGIRNPSTSYS